ncbi:imidazole glycerol phosphate synthase subunit HisH [Cyanobacterium aponinum FACHB-4101]|uniref:Imidazole glycerol phosphate synthase subunit HisH n=1 Tax=Cyanobacterium aponinum 0216 TaxID=2676140 RepID=A0A844H1X9_9CHRO|nr:imidazole glycerol phosphate synthase subunit HisH [Cyanobacterium aponinum]MBD2394694.1 imidazole glycerol phosphate synthase subunit HisH [Cyanobacterium aponinum FACHB-4101]MTF40176.1 imidazole glycerol phosphate synthase subunit HisH [Cyanobacterium aponinum 0216]
MTKIAVIDYDMGNLHSACKGLEKAGANPIITDSPQVIAQADGVVLPGVGSFDPAMQHLQQRDLVTPIQNFVKSGKPFLGICLGLQILFESSEEGKESGLGIIKGQVKRFQSEPDLTIPHMGWNNLDLIQANHPLWQNLPVSPYVYFVHSYFVSPRDSQVIAAQVTHGSQTVTAAIAFENIMAVQFHPEKSSDYGLQILTNFVDFVKK